MFKEKVKVVQKSDYYCEDCGETHLGIMFHSRSGRHYEIDKLPKSVWDKFETNKFYWVEFRKVESEQSGRV